MARRTVGAILPVMVAAVGAGGCDYREPTSTGQARATAQTFVSSCARDRPLTAMRILTEPLRDGFLRAGSPVVACARFLGIAPAGRDDAGLLRVMRATPVVSVSVTGGTAVARVVPPSMPPADISLEFSEGEWKVDQPAA